MHLVEERSEEARRGLTTLPPLLEQAQQKAPRRKRGPLIMLSANLFGLFACAAFVIVLIVVPLPFFQGSDVLGQAQAEHGARFTQGGDIIPAETPSMTMLPVRYDFEDGTLAGWDSSNTVLVATHEQHCNGLGSLRASFIKQVPVETPYISLHNTSFLDLTAGKTLSAYFYVPDESATIAVRWLVASNSKWYTSQEILLKAVQWLPVSFTLPNTITAVREIGLNFSYTPLNATDVSLYLDAVTW